MAIYEIEHPKTGQKITLEGDGVPTDSDIREAFAMVGKQSEWRQKSGTEGRDVAEMQREFIRREGSIGTQLRNTPVTEYIKEPARFAAETGTMIANAGLRGLKGAASLVQGGGEALRTGDIDRGLARFNEKQAEFQPIQSPMAPSAMGEMMGDVAGRGISKLSSITGRPDIVEPVAQGAMDIGTLMGLRTGLKAGNRSLSDLAAKMPERPVKPVSPKVMKQAELAQLSEQYNVPLTVGELRGSTGLKAAETQLERVPMVGTRGFREKQSMALKNAAESLVDNITTGVDDSGIAIQQSLKARLQKGKDLSRQAYDQVEAAVSQRGVDNKIVPIGTKEAANTLLTEYPDIFDRLPSGTVKSKLQVIAQDTALKTKESPILDASGKPITETVQPVASFNDMRSLREQLGNYINRAYKSAGAVGSKEIRQLQILKDAVETDINTWAETTGNKAVTDAFSNANKVYKNNVAPFKEFIVKKATGDTFDTDLMAKTFIKNDRPQLAKKLMGLLDDNGKSAVKHSILKEALDLGLETKTDVPFSPAKFANKLERYGNTLKTVFTPYELTQINGFVKLARAAERAGQYAENPPTGLRAGDLGIFTGFGYGIATNPLATIGTAGALKALSTMLTSDVGRKLLTQSAKIKEGTPQWKNFLNFVNMKAQGELDGRINPKTSQINGNQGRPAKMANNARANKAGNKQYAGEVPPVVISPEDRARIDQAINGIENNTLQNKRRNY